MSVVPVFGRAVAKMPGSTALRCLKRSTFRPLGSITIIQHRSNMAKSISGTAAVYPVIPTVKPHDDSEIPSAYVLSRLNIFDLLHEELETRETDYRLSSGQTRDTREVRRQQALGESPNKNEGGTVTQFLVREGGLKHGPGQERSDQEPQGTVMGSEAGGDGRSENIRRRHNGDGEQRRQ